MCLLYSHSLLDQKINNILSVSSDQVVLMAVQSIIQNMLASEDPTQQTLHFMQSCGFGGLWRFAGPFTKVCPVGRWPKTLPRISTNNYILYNPLFSTTWWANLRNCSSTVSRPWWRRVSPWKSPPSQCHHPRDPITWAPAWAASRLALQPTKVRRGPVAAVSVTWFKNY